MTNARNRSASYENARNSRRTRVSSCGGERARGGRRSWRSRVRHTRKVVDQSLRQIEKSCRIVEAAERFAARRPLRAARQYRRVSDVLNEVTVQLGAAGQTLQTGACELGPEALAGARAHWFAATQKLLVLTGRLADTFDLIMEAIVSGTTLDLSTLATRPSGAAPRVIRLRPRPARRLSRGSSCNLVLRQRRRRAGRRKFAEAARRVFRGRAPPFHSTSLL